MISLLGPTREPTLVWIDPMHIEQLDK